MKNMKGVLPGDEKRRAHLQGLDRAIVDLNRVMKPDFTIVDSIVGMEGTHSVPDDQVRMGLIVAGGDVVAADAVCARLMGFEVDKILHVALAGEQALGVANPEEIEIRGEDIAKVSRRFTTFQEATRERFGKIDIIERNTCTGCMGEIFSMFLYLNKAGFGNRLEDLTVIMGTPDQVKSPKGIPLVIGKCARQFKNLGLYVPGCPPHGKKITDGACDVLRIERECIHNTIKEMHDF